jgi:predicted DNA binding CopG/RHH family protein
MPTRGLVVALLQLCGFRLPQHLLDSIKVAANARDVPYQSLIKVWLKEKLHSN